MLDCTDIAIIEEISRSFISSGKKVGVVSAGSFTGSPRIYDVVFATPMPSATYAIVIDGLDQRSWSYSNRTINGFRINTNANQALTGDVSWSAFTVGE